MGPKKVYKIERFTHYSHPGFSGCGGPILALGVRTERWLWLMTTRKANAVLRALVRTETGLNKTLDSHSANECARRQ